MLAWLTDNVTTATITAPTGLKIGPSSITMYVVPKTRGPWHLYLSATDAGNCTEQSQVVRTVTVQ